MAKILLVEDDNNLREIFEMRLQAEGYSTVTAADGEEALAVAMKERPDLIIADVMMPKLSGFEMLETLRAAPEMSRVKVVMMTALGQAEDRARGEHLGVVKYLVKSQVTLEDFVRVVREVLQPAQADAGTVPAPAMDSANTSSSTNKLESEKTMQDDNSQQPTNPIGGDAAAPDAASATGQQSTADEQAGVNQQVNDFAAAPSAPSSGGGSPFGGDSGASGGTTPGSDVPPSAPPVDPAPAGDDTSGGESSDPAAPAPGGPAQV